MPQKITVSNIHETFSNCSKVPCQPYHTLIDFYYFTVWSSELMRSLTRPRGIVNTTKMKGKRRERKWKLAKIVFEITTDYDTQDIQITGTFAAFPLQTSNTNFIQFHGGDEGLYIGCWWDVDP